MDEYFPPRLIYCLFFIFLGGMSTGKKAKPSYLYAIIGISLVLFLLGTLGWLVLNGRSLSRAFKEDIEVDIELHDNTRPENIDALKAVLDKQPWVKESRIVTKDDAVKLFMRDGGEDPQELLGYNPLSPSVTVKLYSNYVTKDSLEKISRFAMQSNIVRDVTYPHTVVEKMNSNLQKIGLILLGISVVLFGVVVVLIDNTVRLAMFSNRFLIKTMQMVGATRRFITRPFDQRALLNGLISGLVAVAGLWILISLAEKYFPPLRALHDPMMLIVLMGGMIVVGVLISFLSTHRSVVKYLKMHVDDLY